MSTFYGATIKFADGNTRYNGIATAEALAAWLGRYGVAWSAADGDTVAYGPGISAVSIEQLPQEVTDQATGEVLYDPAAPLSERTGLRPLS